MLFSSFVSFYYCESLWYPDGVVRGCTNFHISVEFIMCCTDYLKILTFTIFFVKTCLFVITKQKKKLFKETKTKTRELKSNSYGMGDITMIKYIKLEKCLHGS